MPKDRNAARHIVLEETWWRLHCGYSEQMAGVFIDRKTKQNQQWLYAQAHLRNRLSSIEEYVWIKLNLYECEDWQNQSLYDKEILWSWVPKASQPAKIQPKDYPEFQNLNYPVALNNIDLLFHFGDLAVLFGPDHSIWICDIAYALIEGRSGWFESNICLPECVLGDTDECVFWAPNGLFYILYFDSEPYHCYQASPLMLIPPRLMLHKRKIKQEFDSIVVEKLARKWSGYDKDPPCVILQLIRLYWTESLYWCFDDSINSPLWLQQGDECDCW
eukprot:771598_1